MSLYRKSLISENSGRSDETDVIERRRDFVVIDLCDSRADRARPQPCSDSPSASSDDDDSANLIRVLPDDARQKGGRLATSDKVHLQGGHQRAEKVSQI